MEQPFYVGQKVVALRSSKIPHPIQKGDIVTIAEIKRCSCHRKWFVSIEEFPLDNPDNYKAQCCGYRFSHFGSHYDNFAPLPPAYENISAELAKDATPETSDIIIKPITINN